jgi:hydrogenase expression/formation protein HypC
VRWIEQQGPFARADVEFAGIRRVCHMACLPEAQVGDYVLVHAGIAISRIADDEARRMLESLVDDQP